MWLMGYDLGNLDVRCCQAHHCCDFNHRTPPDGRRLPRLKPMEGLQHKCCSIVPSIGPLFSTFPLVGTHVGEVRSYSHGQNYVL
jgi:hypothetical protein